uniref:Uncharacterized protein n=1 Tax=Oryza sativa subsp. japonica TaxID=39947 RepID=Q6Z5B0_ORYSJ|nr:hypothetical protein [Oryza sativa Japonica Group]BAD30352.1 hypothetical protein [Oryza sativa Japonica Group]
MAQCDGGPPAIGLGAPDQGAVKAPLSRWAQGERDLSNKYVVQPLSAPSQRRMRPSETPLLGPSPNLSNATLSGPTSVAGSGSVSTSVAEVSFATAAARACDGRSSRKTTIVSATRVRVPTLPVPRTAPMNEIENRLCFASSGCQTSFSSSLRAL